MTVTVRPCDGYTADYGQVTEFDVYITASYVFNGTSNTVQQIPINSVRQTSIFRKYWMPHPKPCQDKPKEPTTGAYRDLWT